MNQDDELKRDFMVKRSQMKRRLTQENYKSRWFLLTNSAIKYYDGSLEKGVGKEKGRVSLSCVKVVENVDSRELGGRDCGFQIVYTHDSSHGPSEHYTLYIIAQTNSSRQEWVSTLREACKRNNAEFFDKYHPGVWRSGKFSCCDQDNRNAYGCKTAINVTRISQIAATATSALNGKGIFGSGGKNLKERGASSGYPYSTTTESPPRPNVRNTPLPPVPSDKPKNSKVVIALFDFAGELTNQDLPLEKDKEYIILDDSREHWWKAKNEKGEVGFIPSNYVELKQESSQGENGPSRSGSLERYDWYYKDISRDRCEAILRKVDREGCFLVRDSQMKKGVYTVSVLTKEKPEAVVKHYHIHKNSQGKFYLSENHPQTSIHELILYHKYNAAGLVTRLRCAPHSHSQPATVGLGHDKWELDPSELVLGGELGRGQFGSVYRARWRNITTVAVKMMHQGSMSEDDFIDEAITMQQLQHPNLVQLYGVCTKTRPIYIVTEYAKHGALLNYLKRHKGDFLRRHGLMLDMCVQVCKGMAFLEEKNFIHRDLAARNCLVGDDNIVQVADFGLARYVLDDEYTSSAGSKFPIKWAPPEVLSYTRFSTKSDVWAFGILMWEVFTAGDMPYGHMKNQEVVEFITFRKQRLSKPDKCPPEIYEQMFACWHINPETRPTFAAMLDSLSRLMDEGDYST